MRFGRFFRITPFQMIAFGFLSLILIGTLLLMLPFSSTIPGCAKFTDCLFTATSAVCVTGLVVQDTATFWTPFGQVVILSLIQIGGMGVITTGMFLTFLLGRKIGILQRSLMQESISAHQVGGIVRLTRFIVLTASCFELLGALFLLPVFIPQFGPGKGLWYAVFHSVSAFCNAGFDLMGVREPYSSMTGFSQNPLLNCVIILLITIGGIGFLVWDDVSAHGLHFRQYRLQSKLALIVSAVLIILPALLFQRFEMGDLPLSERLLPSLFQSVTLRTAGFNSMDLTKFTHGGLVLMIVMMLIGGSPGSTAGGIKTTTVAVLILTAWSVFRRKDTPTCFGRRLGDGTIHHAVAIFTMYALLFSICGTIICEIEDLPLISCLFESASAIGTVGLSLGITGSLCTVSRLLLIMLMFLGRIGGLTLVYAAQAPRPNPFSTLPLERVTVG